MNPSELRATVASEQLAALVIASATLDKPFNNELLTDQAIALADLLLAKLNPSAPIKSELIETEPVKAKSDDPAWQRLDVAQPKVNEACRVVTWDHFSLQIGSVSRLYWDGENWQDSDGNRVLGGVTATHVYWFPSHKLSNSETEIRANFLNFIASH